MAAESNVGIRLLLIGKDAVVAGLREVAGATEGVSAAQTKAAETSGVWASAAERSAAAVKVARDANISYIEALDTVDASMAAERLQMEASTLANERYAASMESMGKVGRVAFFGLAAAFGVATYEGVKWATSFQTNLVKLQTQAGLSESAMNAVGKAAMANAASLGISPTVFLQSAYHPASAGFNTPTVIAIATQGANLAAIGGADPEETSNSITALMKAYGVTGAGNAQKQAAFVNAVVGGGNMRLADLNKAISTAVFTTGKVFGVSESSVGGALDYLTDRGMNAAQAGTRLRMGIALLGAPSAQASKYETDVNLATKNAGASAMSNILTAGGLTTSQLSFDLRKNGGKNGIYDALTDIRNSLTAGGVPLAQQASFISRVFGGGRSGTAIQEMYEGLPNLNRKTSQIAANSSQQKYLADLAKAHSTLAFQVKQLSSSLQTLGTAFGQDVIPPLTKAIELFNDLFGFVNKNKAVVAALGTVIVGVLGPAMGVYLVSKFAAAGGALRQVLGFYAQWMKRIAMTPEALAAEDASLVTTDTFLAEEDTALGVNTADQIANNASRASGLAANLKGLGLLAAGAAAYEGTNYVLHHTPAGTAVLAGADKVANFFGVHTSPVTPGANFAAGEIPYLEKVAEGKINTRDLTPKEAMAELTTMDADSKFGKGGASVPGINNFVTVKIDGREVFKSVTKQSRRAAAGQ